MVLSQSEQLTIALTVIIGAFLIAALVIIYYFMRKHYTRSASLTVPLQPMNERRDSTASETQPLSAAIGEVGDSDLETHASTVVLAGVTLLRSCKELSHRLLERLIDGSTAEGSDLVIGSLDAILEASKPISTYADRMTDSMYPPLQEAEIVSAATHLVQKIDNLVRVSRLHCDASRLDWLDTVAVQIVRNFRRLCVTVDEYRDFRATYLRRRAEEHPNVHV